MGASGSKDSRSGSANHQEQSIPITVQSAAGAPSSSDGSGAASVQVPFVWKDEGSNVFLVGSFSNWNNKIPMTRGPEGFTATVPLAPGPYEYKFIVDGQWKCALQQPKVKDRVGNENNWIHVENTTAGVAPDGASAAAADGGLGPLLASETLRSMNLLEVPESPRESYTSEQPTQDMFVKEPPLIPPHLTQCVLMQGASFSDSLLTASPSHVVLNHLYHSELPQHRLRSFAVTRRLGTKFVTSVVYLPSPSSSSPVSSS